MDGREELKDGDDAMFNAIVASLIDYTGAEGNQDESTKKAEADENRQLKEVMALSKLENDKKTGKLNLDFLKRGNNKNSPRAGNIETPANDLMAPPTKSIIPPASTIATTATFVIKGGPGTLDPKLPPPATVTAVVRKVPVPELGVAGSNIITSNNSYMPQPGSLNPIGKLSPMAGSSPLDNLEEGKGSPRLQAPLSLAPLASKSRATLQPLTLPSSSQVAGKN